MFLNQPASKAIRRAQRFEFVRDRSVCLFLVLTLLLLCSFGSSLQAQEKMPWREAGLTETEAAAHLLDRFAFGARPGDIERLLEIGPERWFEQQLAGLLDDTAVERRLGEFDALTMTGPEIARAYPRPSLVRRQAKGSQKGPEQSESADEDFQLQDRAQLAAVMREKGYGTPRELNNQLLSQKVLRAVYSENQLHEVLTDFWFNHFNVTVSKNANRVHVLSYERDAIRPNVVGSFSKMLDATARHPAMLLYLDNALSRANQGAPTLIEGVMDRRGTRMGPRSRRSERSRRGADNNQAPPGRQQTGLNENYARELMELHTLGVDGGYTQKDVVEVARAFTGWTVLPQGEGRASKVRQMQKRLEHRGITVETDGLFLFNPAMHDAGTKLVLGRSLPGGRGVEDGKEVLAMLATHPSTAQFLSKKIATRFVADEPPAKLVATLAETYERSGGNLASVLRTLVASPDFWSEGARRQKIKSPFEVAVSALRAVNANVLDARGVVKAVARMGQPLYAFEAPTGYPDRASAWVNSGSLLNRMNFGLQLATGQLPGVLIDLEGLDPQAAMQTRPHLQPFEDQEPESAERILEAFTQLLMPGRDHSETLGRLAEMVKDPQLPEKIGLAAEEAATSDTTRAQMAGRFEPGQFGEMQGRRLGAGRSSQWKKQPADLSVRAQVVGVILGSPEFQRR